MMLALLVGAAWADCISIYDLEKDGAPLSVVVAQATREGPSEALAQCLADLGAAPQVVAAARGERFEPAALPDDYAPAPVSPTGALGLSVAFGLGTGHFYARRVDLGLLFLVTQTVGAGLMVEGASGGNADLLQGGAVLLGASRLTEVATIGFVAD